MMEPEPGPMCRRFVMKGVSETSQAVRLLQSLPLVQSIFCYSLSQGQAVPSSQTIFLRFHPTKSEQALLHLG